MILYHYVHSLKLRINLKPFLNVLDLTVKTLQNDSYAFQIPLSMTIHNLKQKLCDATSITVDRQRLIYR